MSQIETEKRAVSSKELKKYIKEYLKLKKKTFSLSVHLKTTRIESLTENILASFNDKTLELKPEQYEDFAKFIDVFGRGRKDEYFALLKEIAGYDVRQKTNANKKSLWQKIKNMFDRDSIKYLSERKLERRIKKFISTQKKMALKPWLNSSIAKITDESERYIYAYLHDEIQIKPEDAVAFKHYIKVMAYPIFEGSDGDLALKKLQKEYDDILQQAKAESRVKKLPLKTRLSNYLQNKQTEVKEHFVKNQKWYGRVAAGIVGVVTLGALWQGLKGNSEKEENAELTNQAKTEIKAQKAETKASDEKLIHFSFVSNEYKGIDLQTLMETASKKEIKTAQTIVAKESNAPKAKVSKAKPAKETKAEVIKTTKENNATLATNANDSVKLARSNHHKVVLAMRLGASKSKNMISYIQDKMKNGLIALPANLGAEDFVYAMEMYRGYGVESSLKNAFDKTQKLSLEENQKVIEDIIAAGETGLGVKKMAAAMHGGKLSHKSVYDRASIKFKKQHNKNLQQLLKAKKKMARAA